MSSAPLPASVSPIDTAIAGLTSVMGPDDAALRARIANLITGDPSGLGELTDALNSVKTVDSAANRAKVVDSLLRKFIKPSTHISAKALKDKTAIVAQEVAKIKSTIAASGLNSASATRMQEAQAQFKDSLKAVCEIITKINKGDTKTAALDELIEGVDTDAEDAAGVVVGTTDAERVKRTEAYAKREHLATEKKRLEAKLIEHFDDTLGGMRSVSKYDKANLKLPKNLEKSSARPIIDAFKHYMGHRAQEFYAIMSHFNYIVLSFDPRNGTYFKPSDKAMLYIGIDPVLHEAYAKQSALLYRAILDNIGALEISKISTTFKCGLNKQVTARCAVDDGMMAVYCLLSKWGRNDSHAVTDIESYFTSAPQYFATGSPKHRVEFLMAMMEDAINMNVLLKASQTMIPIYNILADRHALFATGLRDYAEGSNSPNDCAKELESMFAEISRICENIEHVQGTGIWNNESYAFSANEPWRQERQLGFMKGKGKGKGTAKGKGKGKGKGPQGRAFQAAKGKGKGKGKYPNDISTQCKAKGCQQHPGGHKYCTECFRKGLELGHVICKDGSKQILERWNKSSGTGKGNQEKSKADSHNFDKEQLRGLSAVGQHLMERTEELIEARLAQSSSYPTMNISAFGAQPQPPSGPPPPAQRGYSSVFKRMSPDGRSGDSAKKMRFMDKIGQFDDQ
jgi:hypothetical protein